MIPKDEIQAWINTVRDLSPSSDDALIESIQHGIESHRRYEIPIQSPGANRTVIWSTAVASTIAGAVLLGIFSPEALTSLVAIIFLALLVFGILINHKT